MKSYSDDLPDADAIRKGQLEILTRLEGSIKKIRPIEMIILWVVLVDLIVSLISF